MNPAGPADSDELQKVVNHAVEAMKEGLSPQAERIIERIARHLQRHPDYADLATRGATDAVLWSLIHFLDYRMDTTRGNDPTSRYLFADTERFSQAKGNQPPAVLAPTSGARTRTKGKSAKTGADNRDQFEKELQLDCMRFIRPVVGRTARLEASDVAAGRADILVERNRIRLVIEVKREDSDASHDALLKKYGAQATEYSNTSARIGFLLVLDRSSPDGSAGHIGEKVSVRTVRKPRDTEDRMLVIVVMPGKRKRPSAMT